MEKHKSYCNIWSEKEKQSEKILAIYTKRNNFILEDTEFKIYKKKCNEWISNIKLS